MEDWTPPKDAIVSEDSKSKWTPPSDAILDEKKNSIPDSSNGGNITGTESPVSDPPSTSKIKQDNIQKLDLAKSEQLKQGMAKSFAENPSPIYKEHYINKLASLGYDKGALNQFASSLEKQPGIENKNIDLSKQSETDPNSGNSEAQAEQQHFEQSAAGNQNNEFEKSGIGKALNVVPDTFMNSLEGVAKGSAQALSGLGDIANAVGERGAMQKKPLSATLGEVWTGVSKTAEGTLSAGLSGANFVVPEFAGFSTAVGELNALSESTKSSIAKYLVYEGQDIGTQEERAKKFDNVVNFPFQIVSNISDALGYNPAEFSAGAYWKKIGDIAVMAALGKMGADVKENIKSISDLKDISKKMADGTASKKEIKDFGDVSNAMKETTLDEVKKTLDENTKPVSEDELHNKLSELQKKSTDPDFEKLPIEVQSGIMRDIEDTQNDISTKTQEQLNSHIQDADNTAKIAELDNKIEQAKKSQEGQSDVVKESIENTINDLTKQKDAFQINQPNEVDVRQQTENGEGVDKGNSESINTSKENKTENNPVEEKIKYISEQKEKLKSDEDADYSETFDTNGTYDKLFGAEYDLKNTDKIFENDEQNDRAISQLANEDNVEQEPNIKAIEEKETPTTIQGADEQIADIDKKISEATGENSELTKITHAAIEADREKLGLPPIDKEPSNIKQDFIDAHSSFKEEHRDLAKKLIDLQRPATRKEIYTLGLGRVELKAKSKTIREALLEEPNSDELKTQLRITENDIDQNDRALKNVSSEAGKALQAMQVAIAEDNSLEGTLLAARAYAKDGKLTTKEEKTFTEISQRLEEAQKKLAEYEERKSVTEAQQVIDNLAVEEKIKSGVESEIEKINKKLPTARRLKADKAISALDKFHKKIRSNNYSSVPVAILDTAITTIKLAIKAGVSVADAIELGIDKVKELHGKWDNEDKFRDDILSGFKDNDIDTKEKSAIRLTEEGKIKGLSGIIKDLVSRGFKDIDSIVAEIKKEVPEMTDREIRDEISGYGKISELSTDEIDKQVREIKRVGSLISALEDAQKGEAPKRSGLQRDEPTAKEMELRKEINDAMRENQLKIESQPTSPEQLKSVLDKYKKRLQNKLNDLQAKKEAKIFENKKRKVLELDAEALELKRKVDKENGYRKREIEKIRLANRGKLEKTADNIIRFSKFGILAGFAKPIIKLGIAGAAKGYLQNPLNTLIAGIYSNIPGIRNIYKQSPRWRSKGATKALIHGIVEAWSKKTLNDIKSQLKGGKRADEIAQGTDKGHLPPTLWEAWNVEHKILKTPLMNAEYKTSLEKNLSFLNDNGKDITDPVVIEIAKARATQDAERAVYLNKNKLVSAYQGGIKMLEAKSNDGSRWGGILAKMFQGENLIVKVPTNFAVERLQSTPLGFISAAATDGFIKNLRGKVEDLPPEVADRITRNINNATAGTIGLTLGGLLYLNHFGGNKYGLKGQKDKLKEENETIFGFDIPNYAQHYGFAQDLQTGATIARVMDYYNSIDKKHRLPHENHLLKGVWEAEGQVALDIPFIKSGMEIAESFNSSKNVEELMGRYIDAVMSLPGYLAKATDKIEKRQATTPWEHIKLNIPVLRESLKPKKVKISNR